LDSKLQTLECHEWSAAPMSLRVRLSFALIHYQTRGWTAASTASQAFVVACTGIRAQLTSICGGRFIS